MKPEFCTCRSVCDCMSVVSYIRNGIELESSVKFYNSIPIPPMSKSDSSLYSSVISIHDTCTLRHCNLIPLCVCVCVCIDHT